MSIFDKLNLQNSGVSLAPQKLSLFFNYILDFKMGQKKSYRHRETNNFHTKQLNRSVFKDEEDWTDSSAIIIYSPAKSFKIGSDQAEKLEKPPKSLKNQLTKQKQMHYGYSCDHCYVNPIVGQRYHCEMCDYDLCSECNAKDQSNLSPQQCSQQNKSTFHSGHEHPLVLVQRKQSPVLGINELLLSTRGVKSSIQKRKRLIRSQKLRVTN